MLSPTSLSGSVAPVQHQHQVELEQQNSKNKSTGKMIEKRRRGTKSEQSSYEEELTNKGCLVNRLVCRKGGSRLASESASSVAPTTSTSSELSEIEHEDQVITSLQVNSKKAKLSGGEHSKEERKGRSINGNNENKSSIQVEGNHEAAILMEQKQFDRIKKENISRKRAKFVIDPAGQLHYHWSMVVSLAFLYNFWAISYRFSFQEIDYNSLAFWFALDYSADLIYILDVVVNLRTGYLESGVLQKDTTKISQHYRECTRFYLDCFCLLPLDILYLSFNFNSILRFPRLVKIYKFWSYTDRTERHTNYPNVYRTFTLVHYILVIFHWNSCLFHMISKKKIIDMENLYKINGNQCDDTLCKYLHAFYWSTLALTTVGDLPRPTTKGEYFYVIVELFFGLFLFASVLGHVANIVTNVSAARKEFQAKLDAVKTFMRMHRVSDELQSKVIRWFDYLWNSQQNSDEERSVACLPDRLKAELAIHVHLDTLKRVDIFQNTEAGFLCELVLRLKPVLFSPGDFVCRKNEVGHEMYIVSRGILEVVTDEGKTVVATLKAGSYFGEISVLNVGGAGNKRTASVRSVGYSDLFCLNKQDLWDVLKNYPNAEARIRSRAEERLSKLGQSFSTNTTQQSGGGGTNKSARAKKSRSPNNFDSHTQLYGSTCNSCLLCPFGAPIQSKAQPHRRGCSYKCHSNSQQTPQRRRVCSSASCHRQAALNASQSLRGPTQAVQLECCCLGSSNLIPAQYLHHDHGHQLPLTPVHSHDQFEVPTSGAPKTIPCHIIPPTTNDSASCFAFDDNAQNNLMVKTQLRANSLRSKPQHTMPTSTLSHSMQFSACDRQPVTAINSATYMLSASPTRLQPIAQAEPLAFQSIVRPTTGHNGSYQQQHTGSALSNQLYVAQPSGQQVARVQSATADLSPSGVGGMALEGACAAGSLEASARSIGNEDETSLGDCRINMGQLGDATCETEVAASSDEKKNK